ncbi:MAG TPA: HAMP domain-containing sensor histidine kinase [Candidatus Microsaccharimonas sp.]|nr:HAMP domain-containing sensor histidine kinase [Candidatus Microsaccharimonas sp.]
MLPKRTTSLIRTNVLGVTILSLAALVLGLVVFSKASVVFIVALILAEFVLFMLFWQSLRTKHRAFEESKDEFVSLVSHQLRTPLTSMRLFVEMLLDGQVGELNAKQHEYLRMVEISTGRMVDLVSDFLNASKLELGRMEIRPQPTHLEDLVESIVKNLRPLADQQRLTIVYDKQELPEVAVEPTLYSQIVNNLLSNALHYTPDGGTITVRLVQNANGYQLDVTDTGIGIPFGAQAELFKRFYRADNAKHVLGEGSGLGLYLIKRIVDTCGGRVWYESTEGKGTTFHVIIPSTGMVPTTTKPTKQKGRAA